MSLLPIIYTSLLITAGLLVAVITMSYISYKIKNKGEKNRPASYKPISDYNHEVKKMSIQNRNQTEKRPVPKVVFVRKGDKRAVQQKIERPERLTRTLNLRENHTTSINDDIQFDINDNVADKKIQDETKPDFMKKSSSGKHSGRIEILNFSNQVNPQLQDLDENKKLISLSTKLVNGDLLTYYTKDEGVDFYSLKSAGLV